MSNLPNDPAPQNGNHSSAQESRVESEPSHKAFDRMSSGFRKGAEDAGRAAQEALPRVKAAAEEAAYWMAYGLSYAAVFEWTVLKHLAPGAVKSGGRDGVKAGREAAENWVDHMRRRTEPRTPPLLPQAGASSEGRAPGVV